MRGQTWVRATLVAVNLASVGLLAQGAPARQAAQASAEFREVHMGMEVRLVVAQPGTSERALSERAARAAFDRVAQLESVLSDWRPTSELRRLSRQPAGEWVSVSPTLCAVLALALDVARASSGQFDPTVGPLTVLWREQQRTGTPVPDSVWAAARSRVGYRFVELDTVTHRVRLLRDSMRLDLGAIAKGWILDAALADVRRVGVSAALIEAGGDIALFGAPVGTAANARGWRVAVPGAGPDSVLVLTAGAVSTSGPSMQWNARRDGARESHVIDPRTGHGAVDGRSITVVGPSAAITDALATALTLVPAPQMAALAARYGVRIVSGDVPILRPASSPTSRDRR